MNVPTVAAVAIASAVGAVAVPWLTARGLRQLRWGGALPRRLRLGTALVGAAATAVVTGLLLARIGWALLPAYVVWTCALVAHAVCDGMTQRIPTPLVRHSTVVVCLALLTGAGTAATWTILLASAAWAAAAAVALSAAWRFAGAGFGDVRLAVLGGLGLGLATPTSALIGLAVWTAVLVIQAIRLRSRGLPLEARVPLGPGLVAGFLAAALVAH